MKACYKMYVYGLDYFHGFRPFMDQIEEAWGNVEHLTWNIISGDPRQLNLHIKFDASRVSLEINETGHYIEVTDPSGYIWALNFEGSIVDRVEIIKVVEW